MVISAYIAMTAVVQVVIGPLSDRLGRRPTMIASLVVLILATLICLVANDFYILMFGRLLQTAVVAGLVLSRAVIRDMVPMEEAASMIGYVTMGMTLVPMVGPALGGILNDAFGWRASFVAILVLGAVVLALVASDLGETNRNRSESFAAQFRSWPQLLSSSRFWGYTATATFTSGAFFAFLGGSPFVGAAILELTPSMLGMQFFFIAGGYMVGNYCSGRFVSQGRHLEHDADRKPVCGRWHAHTAVAHYARVQHGARLFRTSGHHGLGKRPHTAKRQCGNGEREAAPRRLCIRPRRRHNHGRRCGAVGACLVAPDR